MIELYQLRYFMAVVETGSFTKAAARLNVTQPTLSAGIKKLEMALEADLFRRSNRRVYLTDPGVRFVERAKAILLECNRAAEEVRERSAAPELRLGALVTIPAATIGEIVTRYRAVRPDVRIELIEGTEQELLNRLDDGTIDLALTRLVPGWQDRRSVALYEEGYGLALPAAHALSGKAVIDAAELAEANMIVRSRCEALSDTSRHFTARNVRPPLVYRTPQDERAMEMVAAGLGVTVAPDGYRHPGVVRAKMAGFHLRRTIGFILGLSPRDPAAAEAVRDLCAPRVSA